MNKNREDKIPKTQKAASVRSPWGDAKHDGDITCIIYQSGYLYTGGTDGRIKVWTEDLVLKRTILMHEVYVYALAVNMMGRLYSSSCDGTIKYMDNPLGDEESEELVKTENPVQCMLCIENILYTGDDKGVVTVWENDKIVKKYNLVEEIKSLAVEKNFIYTARDLDAVVSEIIPGESGKYMTRATIPGRAPLALLGPYTDDYRMFYLAFTTRDGKGVVLTSNKPGDAYAVLWTKEDCHEMLINGLCGNDKYLFTAGYDGNVKRWKNLAGETCVLAGEIGLGNCVNVMCNGSMEDMVYTGSSDGIPRRVTFNY